MARSKADQGRPLNDSIEAVARRGGVRGRFSHGTYRSSRWRTGRFGLKYPRFGRHLSDRLLGLVMVLPALSIMLLYVVYPLWTVISTSFYQYAALATSGTFIGLENYSWLLDGQVFLPALGRSVYYTVGSVIVQVGLGFGVALLLNARLPGRNLARGVVLFPFIVPAVVAALIWTFTFNDLTGVASYVLTSIHVIKEPLGWLSTPAAAMNTIIGVAAWKSAPLMIVLFLARLQTVPIDMTEAAIVDGANSWQVFRFVTLPWMLPLIIVAMMLRMIWSFNEFDIPFLLTQGGPVDSTRVLPIVIRQLLFDQLDPGRASAVSTVMIAMLASVGLIYVWANQRVERAFTG